MFGLTIDLTRFTAPLKRAIAAIQGPSVVDTVAREIVLYRLRIYPRAVRKRQPFTSAKQRRYFFAALEDGRIQVPYRRTGALGMGWSYQDGSGTLVNKMPYSDLVQTKGKQSPYHRGTWPTTEDVARAAQTESERAAERVVAKSIRDAGVGP